MYFISCCHFYELEQAESTLIHCEKEAYPERKHQFRAQDQESKVSIPVKWITKEFSCIEKLVSNKPDKNGLQMFINDWRSIGICNRFNLDY